GHHVDRVDHGVVVGDAHDVVGLEVRNRLEERLLGALVALHAGVRLAVLDGGDPHLIGGPAFSLVELGKLFADLAANAVGVESDIGNGGAVFIGDVVVDGDQRDAGILGLLRHHRTEATIRNDDGDA